MQRRGQQLALAQRALHGVSPLATLARGYAIVTRAADGRVLTDAASVEAGAEIEARLGAGRLTRARDPPGTLTRCALRPSQRAVMTSALLAFAGDAAPARAATAADSAFLPRESLVPGGIVILPVAARRPAGAENFVR